MFREENVLRNVVLDSLKKQIFNADFYCLTSLDFCKVRRARHLKTREVGFARSMSVFLNIVPRDRVSVSFIS